MPGVQIVHGVHGVLGVWQGVLGVRMVWHPPSSVTTLATPLT